MGFVVSHVVGFIDNDSAVNSCTFEVAGGAVSILQIDARNMVRPLAEFLYDAADAVVVACARIVLRYGYIMAADAVTGCDTGSVESARAGGGVARGAIVNKVSYSRAIRKVASMARLASVAGKRVWKGDRPDAIVLGSTTVTALATGCISGMC
jgi:hypothetical protein